MKSPISYKQCEIRRGDVQTVAWLPAEFAIVGDVLDIKIQGIWKEGWIVEKAGSAITASVVEGHQKYKKRVEEEPPFIVEH